MKIKAGHRLGMILSLLAIALIGCNRAAESSTPIMDIKTVQAATDLSPIAGLEKEANADALIVLKGKIGNRVPLAGETAYELQDDTGIIWVISKPPVPNEGDVVVIRGKRRYQTMRLQGKTQKMPYIEQQEQLQHIPATTK